MAWSSRTSVETCWFMKSERCVDLTHGYGKIRFRHESLIELVSNLDQGVPESGVRIVDFLQD